MAKCTRGEFLGFGAALAGAFTLGRLPGGRKIVQPLAAQPAAAASRGEPDLVVVNARVLTSDAAAPRAEAFAVKHGRFTAVGSSTDVRNLATGRTTVVDAQRMTVVPGFIDAHSHPSGVQELYGVNTNLRTVREIQSAIRQKAESTPPEVWVTGFMFDDTKLDRPLTRTDLDEATREHPVSVAHRGGHTNFYNSKAFELAGITAQTPDPPDGRFFRENGAAERPGRGERARACSTASASARPSPRTSAAIAPGRGWRTCRSCSTRSGSPRCTTPARRRIKSSPMKTAARAASSPTAPT